MFIFSGEVFFKWLTKLMTSALTAVHARLNALSVQSLPEIPNMLLMQKPVSTAALVQEFALLALPLQNNLKSL